MNPNYKEAMTLTDDTPESSFSGLSDLPEVKNTMEWLSGGKNGNNFRDMLLDDVISERQVLPDVDKYLAPDGRELNKVEEFFYKVKDSFARAAESMPRQLLQITASGVKAAGLPGQESATYTMNILDDVRNEQDFDRALRDFRLGVDNSAWSNKIADMFGQMGFTMVTGSALTSAGVAAGTAGAIAEGLAEGGNYLETDIAAQREWEGGLEAYKGQGLGFATAYGTLAGLVGKIGVEANFLDKLGKFTGKEFAKHTVGELAEEGVQTGLERASRRAQNELYGTQTDAQTWGQDVLSVLEASLLGGLGGATVGGIAFVNNRNRAMEILQDNYGLTKKDARALVNWFSEASAQELQKNTQAMADLSPKSRTMQYAKQTLIQSGMEEKQADRVLESIRKDIIDTQMKSNSPLADNDFFKIENHEDLTAYVRNKAGVQEIADTVVEEEKQAIAERRAELEKQAEKPAGEQPTVQPSEQVTEQPTKEQKTTPVQLELNFLNAKENAINEANNIDAPVLPVQQDLITKEQIEEIQTTVKGLQNQVNELSTAKTPVQAQMAEVGQELNKFSQPKQAESQFATRVAKQTRTEQETPKTHKIRDTKAARQAADELVEKEEDAAWEILENPRADTRQLLRGEVAEALKRKIAKIQDDTVRQEQVRRLINAYSDVATRAGQELQALSEESGVTVANAIADIAGLEKDMKQKVSKTIKNKSAKIEKLLDKITKSDRVMSDKKFWAEMREALECK